MLSLYTSQLPTDEATLRAALAQYLSDLQAHEKTIGAPAPWPPYDILFTIVASGGDFQIIPDGVPQTPPPDPIELARLAAISQDINAATFNGSGTRLQDLKQMTHDQFNAWWATNVTNLAQANKALKYISWLAVQKLL
jgi:hypothetical protein